MNRVINVSNRLPIKVGKTLTKSSGGVVSALEGVRDRYDLFWIGWVGGEIGDPQEQRDLTRRLRDEYNAGPVFLSEQESEDYYLGFSNASLWPLLHYMQTYAEYEDRWYDAYVAINERFAETVLEEAVDGDIVWVHDYHLMLLPSLLKKANPTLKIGFFLHTPFPSYEIFRCHPRREELIQGLMGADLIGFHTFGYLRHFRSAMLRLLELESETDKASYEGRDIRMGVYPIGINGPGFAEELGSDGHREQVAAYEKLYEGKRLILSVERMDYTKGIPRRLAAIEKFLEANPQRRETTVFVIIAVPSRQGIGRYQELISEVESAIGHINGQYATVTNTPIQFIHRGVAFRELCALYARADVGLVTPLIDGMNLVAMEFVACQGDDPGVLVLSEFAGAAQGLFNATMINPYNVHEMAEAIDTALSLPLEDRQKAIEPMKARVLDQDAVWWANRFITDLDAVDPAAKPTSSQQSLDEDVLGRFAAKQGRKALFLDYDGTLVDIVRDPAKAVPNDELRKTLDALSAREDIDVYVVSGRAAEFLEEHLGRHPVTLVAEHGYRVREPGGEWRLFNNNVDLSWKDLVRPILDLYAATTPGSVVEEKRSAVVWHYRNADPEFGRWKSGELIGELMESISNLPVKLHHGKKIVEISSQQVNKGEVMRWYVNKNDYSVVLAAGDDQTDENMFALRSADIVSVKVGPEDTAAEYRVTSPARLCDFLNALSDVPA